MTRDTIVPISFFELIFPCIPLGQLQCEILVQNTFENISYNL